MAESDEKIHINVSDSKSTKSDAVHSTATLLAEPISSSLPSPWAKHERRKSYKLENIVEKVITRLRSEKDSAAHRLLRGTLGNAVSQSSLEVKSAPGIEHPSSTGVIYVMDRAAKKGYYYGNNEWGNFGQGAPEVTSIPESVMQRPCKIEIDIHQFEYGPVAGIRPLREKIASYYNSIYRKGKSSQYTADNICIVPGGRAGLTRIAAAIGDVNVGFFLPEYTAYQETLSVFRRFVPIPTPTDAGTGYHIPPDLLYKEIRARGLSVIVRSNPCNPTGQLVEGEELKNWVQIAKKCRTTLVMDEFYSAFIYTHLDRNPENPDFGKSVSISEYVEDVNSDSVIILDGFTKNFRMPGARICWIVGPKDIILAMQSAGSFLDGGANHPLQVALTQFLDPTLIKLEFASLQKHFLMKRDFVMTRLKNLKLNLTLPPKSTFYVWLNVSPLPEPLNNGLGFFEECLNERVIVVPGIFFDINPNKRRDLFDSPYHHYVRLSFGPPMDQLIRGMDGVERVLRKCEYLI